MKIYNIKRQQFLPISASEAWLFFSSPKNLALITPSYMRFKILSVSEPEEIHTGQIIRYRLSILPGIRVSWVTEMTKVQKPLYFIDEQQSGPYSLWRHQHHFKEVPGGIEMYDEVDYAIPLGLIGQLANFIFVARQVNTIFDFRYTALEKIFGLRAKQQQQ